MNENLKMVRKNYWATVKLQGRYIDFVCAHKNIETVESTLAKLRANIENFNRKAYREALLVCQSVGIEEELLELQVDNDIVKIYLLIIPVIITNILHT